MRRMTLAAVLLVAVLVAAVPAQSATVRVQRFTGFQDVQIAGTQTKYRLRLGYVVPSTWHQRGRASGLSRTFGLFGSCRFTARVTPRTVTDVAEPAASRVARLVPQTRPLLLDAGTRSNAAWRVARTSGTDVVTGVLVRPAPSVRAQPTRGRVWLEVRVTATPTRAASATSAARARSAGRRATRSPPPSWAGSSSSPPGTRPPRPR